MSEEFDDRTGEPLPFGGTGRLTSRIEGETILITDSATGCTLSIPGGATAAMNWQAGMSSLASGESFTFPGSIKPKE